VNGIERRARKRRDGQTYYVWRVRWLDEAGRKRSATFDTERDALDFKAKLRMLRRAGDLATLDAGRGTLAEFVAKWWEIEAVPNLERATLHSYASHWNCHVLPVLGHLKLRKVPPQVIAEFRAELQREGVGAETIRRTLAMLQGVFARAVEWQQIPFNPVKAVRKPRVRRERAVNPVGPGLVERMRRQLLQAGRRRDSTLISVLAYAGVRPEEALAWNAATFASEPSWSNMRSPMVVAKDRRIVGSRGPSNYCRRSETTSSNGSSNRDAPAHGISCFRLQTVDPGETMITGTGAAASTSRPLESADSRTHGRTTYAIASRAF
jgi:Phage integrase, N-terminal SAM-like domain